MAHGYHLSEFVSGPVSQKCTAFVQNMVQVTLEGPKSKLGGWGYGGVLDWANLKSLPRLKQFDTRLGLSEWTTISHHGLECGSRSKNR